MKNFRGILIAAVVAAILLLQSQMGLASRIKDIAYLEGVRENQLVGYGLVVGLNGTGDSSGTKFTIQALVNMMERMGLSVDRSQVKVDNAATVIVTAQLPPFSKPGSTIDVVVSSMGDAGSLTGGTLLMTPLKGPDGKVYAVAQGSLVVGGLAFGGKAAKVQKNHPTVGRVPGGALVEREVAFSLPSGDNLTYRLQDSDFTTVARMASAINQKFNRTIAKPRDSGGVNILIPENYRDSVVDFIAAIENLEVRPDFPAKIVINEKTGTIVMGEDVRLSTVAVSHGNLSLVVSESAEVSQPNAMSQGQTAAVSQTDMDIMEDSGNMVVMPMGVSIGEITRALNAIGASPRDLIAIFQAIKAAGALHAELVIL
ncbi:MAG: flagellar basal body P-ring protein FlgI [Deltaproteobacteria bacterium]|nr:flagellar basal body P-ring protein FlgI [Deltaproteobacteria bacterium]